MLPAFFMACKAAVPKLNTVYLRPMASPVRIGIIGCGKIAPRHAAEASRLGKLVAVCDIVPERADELAGRYAATAYYSIEELLATATDLDLLAVCTPNGLHARHSIQALEAGLHVLCEKPLCIHLADAHAMTEAAAQANRKLFVVKSTRYNPALALLRRVLENGKLGKIYSFQLNCLWNRPAAYYQDTWKGSLELDGGALYTQFSHYIDALLWLLGDVEQVSGFRKNAAHRDTIEFEDEGVASLTLSSGVIGGFNWSLNTYNRNMEVSLTLIAEKGTVRIAGEYMNKLEYQCTAVPDLLEGITEGKANDYGFYKGSMSNHDKVYENMLLALQDAEHPFTSVADGLKTVAAIEQIYRSVVLLHK